MQAIDKSQVTPRENLSKVRWIGPDGGWRKGLAIDRGDYFKSVYAWDEHRGESVFLRDGEYEFDVPKDDAGNPR